MSANSKPKMLAPKKILELSEFSPASNNITRQDTTNESQASRITRHPLLAGMDQKQLAVLIDSAMEVKFKKGEVIFREGEPADRLFLFESGKVARKSSTGMGDPMLGWLGIAPPHTWSCTAYAVQPTTAIFFYLDRLREYCEKDHSLGYELLKRFSLLMYQRGQAIRNEMLTSRSRMAERGYGGAKAA